MTEKVELTEEQYARLERWCDALESGKYRQTHNFLNDRDMYCCLGVACELSQLGKWEDGKYFLGEDYDNSCETGGTDLNHLPSVREYYGFPGAEGFDIPSSIVAEVVGIQEEGDVSSHSLIVLNDGSYRANIRKLTFSQIAQIVRRYLEWTKAPQEEACHVE